MNTSLGFHFKRFGKQFLFCYIYVIYSVYKISFLAYKYKPQTLLYSEGNNLSKGTLDLLKTPP